ncbi:hypothetical protein M378DRAFT_85203, partial [Amanita muscaria Koide BX008]
MRSPNHRILPNFIGQSFPRRDDPTIAHFYSACMLMLLKPWRDLQNDLKETSQTWTESFHQFLQSATDRAKLIVSGIQYFHDCDTAA